MKNYDELINKALEELKENDELFVDMVNEVDAWNGFADGFRAYPMYEINELFYGVSIGDFLDKLSSSFDHTDEYFIDTIYGLASTNDITEHYRDNVDEGELLDEIIDNFNHLFYGVTDNDFVDLINEIIDAREVA